MVSSWMAKGLGDALARQGRDEIGVEAEAREGCGHWGVARFRQVGRPVGTGCPPPSDDSVAVGRTSGRDGKRCER